MTETVIRAGTGGSERPATEPPRGSAARLRIPEGPVDAMLTAAARTYPDRAAIRTEGRKITYAALDAMATDWAKTVHDFFGGRPGPVAVAQALDPLFPAVYYGILRAGGTAAVVNPLLPAPLLLHVLRTCGARLAVLPRAVYERLLTVREGLPALERVIVLGEESPETGSGAAWQRPEEPGDEDRAVILFTSGSTGTPKAVQLSHRNVKVNTAQMAASHRIGTASRLLLHLPIYHPMHMNTAVSVAATQILSAGAHSSDALALADRTAATHYYTFPARLLALAADPDLAMLRPKTVGFMATGGTAVPPAVVRTLADALGVGLMQGYGMCETSSLATGDDPDAPKPGSVGIPLAGSSIRIVEPGTGRVLPAHEIGEIQVRGPHVMQGYLGHAGPSPVDAAGWLATGDMGHLDEDGYLFMFDRLKDVFRCGGELVSPTAVERVLYEHPAVRDCAVVGTADAGLGSVAVAFVVLADGAGIRTLPAVVDTVNDALSAGQRIRRAELVRGIPRLANGKVDRGELRTRLGGLGDVGDA